ncbi:nuclear transport factor 2 family protein [Couchioplanes azureus]|uniref:nuclear transport factor 2 family protein n=1 Tax=Couchioplanes caeruleus TaxID=56438 RepID=UPI001670BDB9|nr:nuclear transport factor 2 family protein [Couchioplanes caeruleus]GGQ86058.1 hypothetical protein GCM10010166_65310 [Couchioplanes caeruleus subsp. azureus]
MSVQTQQQVGNRAFAEVYAEVQQFYARQMYLLDTGDAEQWAATFTEDGSFAPPSAPAPIRGRETLAAGAKRAAQELAEAGQRHRHLLLAIDVEPQQDDSLVVRSYAQIVATPRGGESRIHLMCETHDVLVRDGDRLLVKDRRVTRDDQD